VGVLALACSANAATIGLYTFTTAETDKPTLANASFSSFTRTGVSQSSATGVFQSSGYGATGGNINLSQYVEFTITPSSGYQINLTQIPFDMFRSGNGNGTSAGSGPLNGQISVFNAGTLLQSQAFSPSDVSGNVVFNFTDFATQGQVSFRFYGWNAKDITGTLALDNVQIDGGGVTPVPEPVNVALALFGITAVGVGASRRFLARAKK